MTHSIGTRVDARGHVIFLAEWCVRVIELNLYGNRFQFFEIIVWYNIVNP